MKKITSYFTQDQLDELKKIVDFISPQNTDMVEVLLEATNLYAPLLKYLADSYIQSRSTIDKGSIITLFGRNYAYKLLLNVSHLPKIASGYCIGERKGYIALTKEQLEDSEIYENLEKYVVMGFVLSIFNIATPIPNVNVIPMPKKSIYKYVNVFVCPDNNDILEDIPNTVEQLHITIPSNFGSKCLNLNKFGNLEKLTISCGEKLCNLDLPTTVKKLCLDFEDERSLRRFFQSHCNMFNQNKGLELEVTGDENCTNECLSIFNTNGFIYDIHTNSFFKQY